MIEVTNDTFGQHLPDVEDLLRRAQFVAIDSEFTALYNDDASKPSILDTAAERYRKIRATCNTCAPLQVGVTIFIFDGDANAYDAHTYAFYTWPKAILNVGFDVQVAYSTLEFLAAHAFDFNTCLRAGVPYLNDVDVCRLRADFAEYATTAGRNRRWSGDDNNFKMEDNMALLQAVHKWYGTAELGDEYVCDLQGKPLRNDMHALFCLQYELRAAHPGALATKLESGRLLVTKTNDPAEVAMSKLYDDTVELCMGMSYVFRALAKWRKPIVGHNMFMDLMLFENAFGASLPASYSEFKAVVHGRFPVLYDTKCIAHVWLRTIRDKLGVKLQNCSLEQIYTLLSSKKFNSRYGKPPAIRVGGRDTEWRGNFHHAGWDSYCTGYAFIHMVHNLSTKGLRAPPGITYRSTEYFSAVHNIKNQLNLIQASISHIVMDGEDPKTTRPPRFIVESIGFDIDEFELQSQLSQYGHIVMQRLTNRRMLVAINNFGNARRLKTAYEKHAKYKVKVYNPLVHHQYAPYVHIGISILAAGIVFYNVYQRFG